MVLEVKIDKIDSFVFIVYFGNLIEKKLEIGETA